VAKTQVRGEVVFPAGTPSFGGAEMIIRIEDVGLLGMPAQVISEKNASNIAYQGAPLSFSVDSDFPESGGSYNLSVHIRTRGGSDINKGDFITKRGYSISSNDRLDNLRIEVEVV